MRKALKIVGFIVLGVIIIIGLGAGYVQLKGIPTYSVEAPELKLQGDSAMVAEGKRMSVMLCSHCHMASNGKLEGNFMDEGELGKLYAPNITQHPEMGIGQYTDGELAYLLRTGIKRNGEYAPPYMPKFPHMSDEDLHSIIAFLRSEEPEVQPSEEVQPKVQPSFLTKMLSTAGVFAPLPYPESTIQAPPMTDKVAYGRYLVVGKVECYGCHSADFTKVDMLNPEKSAGYFGGGNVFNAPDGSTVYSSNLTPDQATGIGDWTETQFITALRTGQRPNGKTFRWPMLAYGELSEEEASAIWAYLQTLPAIKNEILEE